MEPIAGVGRGTIAGMRPARGRTGFARALEAEQGESAAAPAPVQAVGLPLLLAVQERDGDAQDGAARRHGSQMMDALAALQRALLGEGGGAELQRLASLARAAPPASDPALAAVQRAVLVRAAVELARGRA